MKDKIGIGILSFAHGHSNVYCQVIRNFKDAEVIAAWDANPERGQAAAQKAEIDFRPRVEDILADPRIDAVIVTAETNNHAGLIEQAAAAGKHILCQKPLATTLADCDRIIAAVKKHGVKFSMALQMRHDPVNQKIKELLQAGAVGKVAVVRRRHSLGVLLDPNFVNGFTRWHVDPVANVGMFFDEAAHTNDWYYWMLGQPRSVMAEIDNVTTQIAADDNGVAVYRFQNGEIGELQQSSTTLAAVSTTEIYGDEGTIVQDYGDAPGAATPRPDNAPALRLIRKGETQWTDFGFSIPKSQAERLMNIPRPFVNYLRGLSDQTISAEEGRVAVEMSIGAYLSAKEGRRVALPLI